MWWKQKTECPFGHVPWLEHLGGNAPESAAGDRGAALPRGPTASSWGAASHLPVPYKLTGDGHCVLQVVLKRCSWKAGVVMKRWITFAVSKSVRLQTRAAGSRMRWGRFPGQDPHRAGQPGEGRQQPKDGSLKCTYEAFLQLFDEFNFSITLTNNEMNTDALNGRFHTKSSANNLDYNQLPLIRSVKKAWKIVKYKIRE